MADARDALDQFSSRKVNETDWANFAASLDYVPLGAGADALRTAVERAEQSLEGETRRVHYLSVPPNAAMSAVSLLAHSVLELPSGRAAECNIAPGDQLEFEKYD